MSIRCIEISFPTEVELPDGFDRLLDAAVDMVCKAYERSHPDRVMWPAGRGSKPSWSAADAAFFGVEAPPGAPDSGEPTFDDSVYCIEVSEREDLHGTNPHNPNRDVIRERLSEERRAEKARRKAASPQLTGIHPIHSDGSSQVRLQFDRALTDKELASLRKSFE